MICFECPGCSRQIKVKDELAGKKGKCPGCGMLITGPTASQKLPAVVPQAGKVSPAPGPRPMGDNTRALPTQGNAEASTVAPDAPVGALKHAAVETTVGGAARQAVGRHPAELTDFLAPPQAPDELGRLGPYRVLAILGAG